MFITAVPITKLFAWGGGNQIVNRGTSEEPGTLTQGAPVFPGPFRLGIEPKTPGWLVQDPTTSPFGDLEPTQGGCVCALSCVYFQGHRAKPVAGLHRRAPKGRPTWTPPPCSPSTRIPRRPGGIPVRAQRYCPGLLRPELSPELGRTDKAGTKKNSPPLLTRPATGSHIVPFPSLPSFSSLPLSLSLDASLSPFAPFPLPLLSPVSDPPGERARARACERERERKANRV